jgi:hypothetical protein
MVRFGRVGAASDIDKRVRLATLDGFTHGEEDPHDWRWSSLRRWSAAVGTSSEDGPRGSTLA